ncbi:MAG: hypothetical protein GY847_25785 [Proteobacteria bacterium]|nr:hypothetical protein [Pseudomonadota bacterium]
MTKNKMLWGVCANIKGDRLFRDGAKLTLVWLTNSVENFYMYGISRGGRRIEKWVSAKRLYNPRLCYDPHGGVPNKEDMGNRLGWFKKWVEAARKGSKG